MSKNTSTPPFSAFRDFFYEKKLEYAKKPQKEQKSEEEIILKDNLILCNFLNEVENTIKLKKEKSNLFSKKFGEVILSRIEPNENLILCSPLSNENEKIMFGDNKELTLSILNEKNNQNKSFFIPIVKKGFFGTKWELLIIENKIDNKKNERELIYYSPGTDFFLKRIVNFFIYKLFPTFEKLRNKFDVQGKITKYNNLKKLPKFYSLAEIQNFIITYNKKLQNNDIFSYVEYFQKETSPDSLTENLSSILEKEKTIITDKMTQAEKDAVNKLKPSKNNFGFITKSLKIILPSLTILLFICFLNPFSIAVFLPLGQFFPYMGLPFFLSALTTGSYYYKLHTGNKQDQEELDKVLQKNIKKDQKKLPEDDIPDNKKEKSKETPKKEPSKENEQDSKKIIKEQKEEITNLKKRIGILETGEAQIIKALKKKATSSEETKRTSNEKFREKSRRIKMKPNHSLKIRRQQKSKSSRTI